MPVESTSRCKPAELGRYLLHHANCPTCKAAGAMPGKLARCTEGLQLWNVYLRATAAQSRKK